MEVKLGNLACSFRAWRPEEGRIFDRFAYDTETTEIDDDRPYLTPTFVIGAACNGRQGVFLTRKTVLPFFEAHTDTTVIMHNARFDLKVTAPLLQPTIDLYEAVEANRVYDTMTLKRLFSLATVGNTARDECSLAHCAAEFLGVALGKDEVDGGGNKVRTGFGQFLGRPASEIPTQYLAYLGQDVLATWHLFLELHQRIKALLQGSHNIWGYVNQQWLRDVVHRFGPLTHHIQLRASILMDVLSSNGIAIDPACRDEKAQQLDAVKASIKERLRQRGYLPGEPGNAKALQSILNELHRNNPGIEMNRTASGKQWSTAEEDIIELASLDSFFQDYCNYRSADKLRSTYLKKMGPARVYPRFEYLLETGRTSCRRFNVQNLPREDDLVHNDPTAATIRGCLTPDNSDVFIDSDFGQIELVVLAYALEYQFGIRSRLKELINGAQDVHKLIAANVLGKNIEAVSKAERNSAKPVSFGRPGGMGIRGLKKIAKSSYGIEFDDEQVQRRIDAYHELCPELTDFLNDQVDTGMIIAVALQLAPAQYYQAIGGYYDPSDPVIYEPVGWLGGMLLKVLGVDVPVTRKGSGRPYTAQEIDFFWDQAQHLPIVLNSKLSSKLHGRQASTALSEAVRDWAGLRSVFTFTGRLRANTTFCSSRNCIFQGPAADGAILGLWRVWRAGYKLVNFIHDQIVTAVAADDRVKDRVVDIERLMKEGMAEVVPGMLVKVETVVTASMNKKDLDRRYDPTTFDMLGASTHAVA
jgi:hypothetical protein